MTKEEFVKHRQEEWKRFEALLSFAEGRPIPSWSGEDVSEFSKLFRAISYDLSLVRSRDWGRDLSRYLNNLVGRAHSCFYRAPPGSLAELVRFFAEEFPWLLRRNLRYFITAILLFLVPGMISGTLISQKPEIARRLFAEKQLDMFAEMHSGDKSEDFGQTPFAATGGYVKRNVSIAFCCFAGGILFGVGSVVYLVYNGLAIGGIAGYMVAVGNKLPFFAFVVSHGSFELTAIVIAGAAGLIIGHAMVHPGERSFSESLRIRGLVGVKLALGAGAMLFIAAAIEGFWSPSFMPPFVKFVVGGLFWVLVIAYLCIAGRNFVPNEKLNRAQG